MQELIKICEHVINPLGYEVVRVQFNGNKKKALQIMIEKNDGSCVNIDDCVLVSRHMSLHLDANDTIKDPYHLEISSTGIDRPLTKSKDYQRFIGKEVLIKTFLPFNDRKTFKGILLFANNELCTLEFRDDAKKTDIAIDFKYDEIKSANLVV